MLRSIYHCLNKHPFTQSLRQSRYQKRFSSGKSDLWNLNGYYRSFAEAEHACQQMGDEGFSKSGLYDNTLRYFNRINCDDYAVLYWLRQALQMQSNNSLVEFGGHLGAKFSTLSPYLELPADFKWQIVETPNAVAAASMGNHPSCTGIDWFTKIEQTRATDILYCSGSLQYIDTDILDLVEQMPTMPNWLILNRLALCKGPGFTTLENFAGAHVAYTVRQHRHHNQALASDYELMDTWHITDYSVPYILEADASIQALGQVWRKKLGTD